jgi:uncharacterized protein
VGFKLNPEGIKQEPIEKAEPLVPSKYNIIFKNEGKQYIYNTFRDSLIEADNEAIAFLESVNKNGDKLEAPTEILDVLCNNGFLIKDSKNEIADLKVRNRIGRYYVNSLGLTITPTLECNFSCNYCFEKPIRTSMTQKVMDAVYDFVISRLKDKKAFGITWYGGEPLLALDTIGSLSTRFMRLSDAMGIEYSADIISNGYLMTKETAKMLTEQFAVTNWQVTIDGPKDVHDKRRILKNGSGTFDTILYNLKESVDCFRHVILRVNVDIRNWDQVPDLLDILEKEGLKNKVMVTVTKVEPFTDRCRKIEEFCLLKGDFAKHLVKLSELAAQKGFDITVSPKIYSNYCTADCMDSFVIDAFGNIAKCWNSVGRNHERIGTVFQEKLNDLYVQWLAYDPFERKECLACKFMPICMGGCPYSVLYENSLETCPSIRYMLPEMLHIKHKYGFLEKEVSNESRCHKRSEEC